MTAKCKFVVQTLFIPLIERFKWTIKDDNDKWAAANGPKVQCKQMVISTADSRE